jgi:hypothetical protein
VGAVLTTDARVRGGRGGGLLLILAAVGLAAVFLLVANIFGAFGFGERTVDRSQPPLLVSLADLSEYRAATANFEVIVDLEKDTKYLPDFVKGQRVIMVAAGNVDASVDFGSLRDDDVEVSADRRTVRITLPAARLTEVRLDNDRTYVADRQRGLADRIAGVFGNPANDQFLYQAAEQKLADAAAASQILELAETNTRSMLTSLLRSLGFENITITFVEPANP